MVADDLISSDLAAGGWEPGPGPWNHPREILMARWFGLTRTKGTDAVQALVYDVYRRYKIGKREPNEPFIRRSLSIDDQIKPHTGPIPFPTQKPEIYDFRQSHCILHGDWTQKTTKSVKSASWCFYRFSGQEVELTRSAARQFLGSVTSPNFETKRYACNKALSSTPWNLGTEETMGQPNEQFLKDMKKWYVHLTSARGLVVLPSIRQSHNEEKEVTVID